MDQTQRTAAKGQGTGAPGPERLQVQVIARAAAILRALEGRTDGLSLGEIAAQVGLPRSTVQRIAAALQSEELLSPVSPAGRLRLGPAIRRLAGSMTVDIVSLARPHIRALSELLDETVDLAVVSGNAMLFLDQIVGNQRLRTVSAVGEAFPLHCTANGKAYLASLPDPAVRRLLGPALDRRTDHTITDLSLLMKDLARVRRRGVAFDQEEHTDGISAVGIVLPDATGRTLAISVPVPTSRFAGRRDALSHALLDARLALSAAIHSGGADGALCGDSAAVPNS